MVSVIISAYVETIKFINTILQYSDSRKLKKLEEQLVISKIILSHRNLELLEDNYDSSEILKMEKSVSNYLKTMFDDELYCSYIDKQVDVYWSLRYGSKISNHIIEESLVEFIKTANKKGYKVK